MYFFTNEQVKVRMQNHMYTQLIKYKYIKFFLIFNIVVILFKFFDITNKLNKINLIDNNQFEIKLISSLKSCNNFKYMKIESKGNFYTGRLKEIAKELDIKIPMILYFRRKLAAMILKILQTPLVVLKEQGMQNFHIYNKYYNEKLYLSRNKIISRYKQ